LKATISLGAAKSSLGVVKVRGAAAALMRGAATRGNRGCGDGALLGAPALRWQLLAVAAPADKVSHRAHAKSSLGDAESSRGDTRRARWLTLRSRGVTR
jgi:hypothetical protein